MKIRNLFLLALITFVGLTSCQKESLSPATTAAPEVAAVGNPCPSYQGVPPAVIAVPGVTVSNVINIDGDPREYLIYLPFNYNVLQDVDLPVVFMHHGSGQTAGRMVNVTRWNDLADLESLIIVYPQSWDYDLTDGSHKTKWATDGTAAVLAPGEVLRDDLKFISTIRNSVVHHLRADCRRVYACGFSNGGAFTKTEIRIHLNDAFAATSSTGGIGMPFVISPASGPHVPHFETCGTLDANAITRYYTPPLPAALPTNPAVWPTEPFWGSIANMATSMGFNPVNYVPSAAPPSVTYGSLALGVSYRFRMIPNLIHKYKSSLTPAYWAFMSPFSL